ncbi:MAG: hypothetical protein U0694_09675 [Anaerolineae bacterium]
MNVRATPHPNPLSIFETLLNFNSRHMEMGIKQVRGMRIFAVRMADDAIKSDVRIQREQGQAFTISSVNVS